MMKFVQAGVVAAILLTSSTAFALHDSWYSWLSWGDDGGSTGEPAAVPELSGDSTGGAILLILGSIVVLADRRRRGA